MAAKWLTGEVSDGIGVGLNTWKPYRGAARLQT